MTAPAALSIRELPRPPRGRTGWPWTEETPPLPPIRPDGTQNPRISVITPSFNQGQYLEETIRSVLLQGYPNLEFIIQDGASSDDSVAILRKYAPFLDHWASEPDRGQSDALNQGFRRATGDLMGWLNSDDVLLPGALQAIATAAGRDRQAGVYVGGGEFINARGKKLSEWRNTVEQINHPLDWRRNQFFQPSAYFRRTVWEAVGPLDVSLHYAMDVDLWVRAARQFHFCLVPGSLSRYRLHTGSKSVRRQAEMDGEFALVQARNGGHAIVQRDVTNLTRSLHSIVESLPCRLARGVLPARLWHTVRRLLGVR
jgi:glycosyltransferase involved in cell wall biosynthesis